MAGSKEIKTKIILDGEAQFKKAMSDAASSIKELTSEQKLAEAQFEATGDAEQYAADKTRILKEKIEQQQKVVKAAEEAVRAMKDKGVDPNNKAMQTWRTKLNNAKTSLVNMQTQLDKTEGELGEQATALNDAEKEAGEFSEAMDKTAKAVDYTATMTAIDNVREKIAAIIETAGRAAMAMWNLERGAAGWADELQTNADIAGLDVVDYQGWLYASQKIDSSVDSIRGAYKRLNKNLDEPTDDILKSLNELNVANLDPLSGSARETMEVFWDIVDALGRVENTSRRDQLAMELFGKSFDDLLPLIKEGSAEYQKFIEEGKKKAVSQESIDNLTSLDDAINDLNASFDQTKYTVLAELAPAFESAATAMTGALGAFNDFLKTDEGQKSLENMRNAIGGVANQIQNTDWKKVMSDAASIITKITDALGWLGDHSEVVIGAVAGLGTAWAGLTVSKDVLSVLQLLNTIKWAQIVRAGSMKGGGIKTVADNVVKTTGVETGGSNPINAIGAAGTGSVIGGIVGLGSIAAGFIAAANERLNNLDIRGSANAIAKETEQTEGLKAALIEYVAANRDVQALMDQGLVDSEPAEQAFRRVENARAELKALEGYKDVLDAYSAWRQENSLGDMDWSLPEEIADDITAKMDIPIAAAEEMAQQAAAATDASSATYDSGYNTVAGYAQGIKDAIPLAVGATEALAAITGGTLVRRMEIKSPSKVMERLGQYVSEGFARGIEDNVASVERATNRMAYATMGRAASARPAERGGGAGGMVHVTLMLDGQAVGDVVTPYVDGNMAAQISRRR